MVYQNMVARLVMFIEASRNLYGIPEYGRLLCLLKHREIFMVYQNMVARLVMFIEASRNLYGIPEHGRLLCLLKHREIATGLFI